MNYGTLPNDLKEVVFKIKESCDIYAGTFIDGTYISVIAEEETIPFSPEEVECWEYAESLFNAVQTLKPEPETFIVSKHGFDAATWDQRRYEIAKDVLAGSVSNEGMHGVNTLTGIKDECERAIIYADTLIEMLKEGND